MLSYDNHIKFEVSLHFWRIWPTVRLSCLYEIFRVTLQVQNKDCFKVRISDCPDCFTSTISCLQISEGTGNETFKASAEKC